MPSLTALLGNPLSDLLKGASDIIGRFVADPDKKIEAQQNLLKIQSDFQLELVKADVDWAKTQAESIEAETKSESWLARNWRPITMMTFVFIIAYNFIFAQWWSLKLLPIPPDMWSLIKIGLGGYVFGRTAEKIIPDSVASWSEGKAAAAQADK